MGNYRNYDSFFWCNLFQLSGQVFPLIENVMKQRKYFSITMVMTTTDTQLNSALESTI